MLPVFFLRDARLNLHEPRSPAVNDAGSQLLVEQLAGSTFFIGIGEGSEPVELHLFHKTANLVKFLFRLSGIAGNHRGPHSHTWHLIANVSYESLQALDIAT